MNDHPNHARPRWIDGSQVGDDSALQVLAVAASNRESYHGDPSSPPPLDSNGALNVKQDVKANRANGDAKESGGDAKEGGSSGRDGDSKRTTLRGGKWSAEEEEYATRLILYLSTGVFALPEGKSIRAFLAEKLQCDPMRVTKKYSGAGCLGYPVSRLCGRRGFSSQYVKMANSEIARLERRFHLRLALGKDVLLPPESAAPASANSNDASSFLPEVIVEQTSETINDRYPVPPQSAKTNAQSAPVMHQAENSTIETPAPSTSSRLVAPLNNARITATSSLSSNGASVLVKVPHPLPPPSPDAQRPHMPQHNRQQPTSQAPLPAAAMNLATILENISKAIAKTSASSLSAPAAVNNDESIKTILLQFFPQLEALATPLPTALVQILVHILGVTLPLPSIPPAASQRPNYAREVPTPLVASSGGDDVATLLAKIQLAAAGKLSTNLQTLLPAKNLRCKAQVAFPLLNVYAVNSLGVAANNTLANPPFIQPLGTPHVQVPIDQRAIQGIQRCTLAQKANKTPSNNLPSMAENNMAELVRGFDKPVEQVNSEQCWRFRRGSERTASGDGCAFRQGSPQSTFNLINTTITKWSSPTKKQKLEQSNDRR